MLIIRKIVVAGTFDILHPGHIFLINEAAKLGEVYVIVATDKNRERFTRKLPIIPEDQRLEVIKSLKNVKDARLGRKGNNILLTILDIKPDVILLGPNQDFQKNNLKNALKKIGLDDIEVKRLDTYYDKYELNSSSLIKRKIIKNSNQKKRNKRLVYNSPIKFGEV